MVLIQLTIWKSSLNEDVILLLAGTLFLFRHLSGALILSPSLICYYTRTHSLSHQPRSKGLYVKRASLFAYYLGYVFASFSILVLVSFFTLIQVVAQVTPVVVHLITDVIEVVVRFLFKQLLGWGEHVGTVTDVVCLRTSVAIVVRERTAEIVIAVDCWPATELIVSVLINIISC